jgi:DNA mismatch repair protein MutS2
MDRESLESLDFFKLKESISGFCFSQEGQASLLAEEVYLQEETWLPIRNAVQKVLQSLYKDESLPLVNFPPVADLLPALSREGAVLEAGELRDLSLFFRSAGPMKQYAQRLGLEALAEAFPDLGDLPTVMTKIIGLTDPSGDLLEEKIPSLRNIRKAMGTTHNEISLVAKAYLSGDQKDLWQNKLPTQKDGRVVLAMKSQHKSRVPGVVHDSSGSGATLYVEPLDIMEKNNRLVQLGNEYRMERLRILREWTAHFSQNTKVLQGCLKAIVQMDRVIAKARFGQRQKGGFVQTQQGFIRISGGRHPLLGDQAVPITLHMDQGIQALVVSGPNTGGKTVSLKTLGLFVLLHQLAVPLPAEEDSNLPFFQKILTDIGDRQSLEGQLSTFSGHMARIGEILGQAGAESLIILDELGTGTDPREGGALAVSILEEMIKTSSTILITTHFPEVKNFAFSTKGVKNASMAFDDASGKPTYAIVPDLPGDSHALEMAQANGIPGSIIEKARASLEGSSGESGALIRSLLSQKSEMEDRLADLASKEKMVKEKIRNLDLKQLQVKQKESELRDEGIGELRRFLSQARKTLEGLIKDIREGKDLEKSIRQARDFSEELRAKQIQEEEAQARLEEELLEEDQDLQEGLEVWVEPGNKRGTILKDLGKGRFQVSVGSIKLTIKSKDLRAVASKDRSPKTASIQTQLQERPASLFTLDLRGLRLEEALIALESQIDRAILDNLQEFSVIHGLGEGILQRGVKKYLRKRPEVQEFFHPRPEEGGYGKTVVKLG